MKSIHISTEPISVNALYTGRRFLTKNGKATKEAMSWEIKSWWKHEPLKDDVCINVLFYFKDNRKDIDGCLKALLDCMQGIVYENDRQITELHIFKMIDKKKPRVEIQVL